MLLDLRHFQMKIETLTRLRPLPDAALVETYIKAFYLPETALDEFVQQHTVKKITLANGQPESRWHTFPTCP